MYYRKPTTGLLCGGGGGGGSSSSTGTAFALTTKAAILAVFFLGEVGFQWYLVPKITMNDPQRQPSTAYQHLLSFRKDQNDGRPNRNATAPIRRQSPATEFSDKIRKRLSPPLSLRTKDAGNGDGECRVLIINSIKNHAEVLESIVNLPVEMYGLGEVDAAQYPQCAKRTGQSQRDGNDPALTFDFGLNGDGMNWGEYFRATLLRKYNDRVDDDKSGGARRRLGALVPYAREYQDRKYAIVIEATCHCKERDTSWIERDPRRRRCVLHRKCLKQIEKHPNQYLSASPYNPTRFFLPKILPSIDDYISNNENDANDDHDGHDADRQNRNQNEILGRNKDAGSLAGQRQTQQRQRRRNVPPRPPYNLCVVGRNYRRNFSFVRALFDAHAQRTMKKNNDDDDDDDNKNNKDDDAEEQQQQQEEENDENENNDNDDLENAILDDDNNIMDELNDDNNGGEEEDVQEDPDDEEEENNIKDDNKYNNNNNGNERDVDNIDNDDMNQGSVPFKSHNRRRRLLQQRERMEKKRKATTTKEKQDDLDEQQMIKKHREQGPNQQRQQPPPAFQFRIQIYGSSEIKPPVLRPYNRQYVALTNITDFVRYQVRIGTACDALLALVDRQKHPEYFRDQLTGTIPQALAYQIPIVLHEDLIRMYRALERDSLKRHNQRHDVRHPHQNRTNDVVVGGGGGGWNDRILPDVVEAHDDSELSFVRAVDRLIQQFEAAAEERQRQ